MTAITVTLADDSARKLQALAAAAQTPPEDLVRAAVEEWLNHPQEDFSRAAEYVLRKNAELYRRLA